MTPCELTIAVSRFLVIVVVIKVVNFAPPEFHALGILATARLFKKIGCAYTRRSVSNSCLSRARPEGFSLQKNS